VSPFAASGPGLGYGFRVTLDFVIRNWSLVIASVLLTAIALFVLYRLYSDSSRGQLGARIRSLELCYRDVDRAQRAVRKAERRLDRLDARAASVKPRHVEEARDTLTDARSLLKIAEDQVLIAENHVRTVIVEEFPPKRHKAMRRRYLRRPAEQG